MLNETDVSQPSPASLEHTALTVARLAADQIRSAYGSASTVGLKSSATDVVTQTDLDTEQFICEQLRLATPGCGIIGEEGGSSGVSNRLQWVVDPLDGTVNFLYGVPIFSVSIAAALDGSYVAGAVVDVMRGDEFSSFLGGGARCNGSPIRVSSCEALCNALVATGFSYTPRLRAAQGEIVRQLLPVARDIRCFGSAALNLCWTACGRVDAYFERDIKIWDWAAGALIATEAGAEIEYPCPENDGLVFASTPIISTALRGHTAIAQVPFAFEGSNEGVAINTLG